MKRTLGIVAALLLAAAVTPWLHQGGSSPSPATHAVAVSAPQPEGAAPAAVEPTAPTSAAPPATPARVSVPVASEQRVASLVQAMQRRAYEGLGPRLVDYLARQGLARADAEPIVNELLGKTVICALHAVRAQALEQRVELDQVLSALEAESYDADGPLLTALLDVGSVDRRAMPCAMTAVTQAGIPPQAAAELFSRQNR